jgi:hypothetical protein
LPELLLHPQEQHLPVDDMPRHSSEKFKMDIHLSSLNQNYELDL